MRRAGLLKPRTAAESEELSETTDIGTQEMSAVSPAAPEGSSETHDVSADERGDVSAEERDDLDVTPAPSDTDSTAGLAGEGDDVSDDSTPSEATDTPERTSVFDRFSAADGDDPVPADDEPVDPVIPAPAVKPEDVEGEDEKNDDYAGALRARLKAAPPADEQSDVVDSDDIDSPSRWKTLVLFLLLIIVGFGVGILIGSVIFSGGSQSAAADALTMYNNPGAL